FPLTVHPVKTQVISSGILWGTGDIAAQTITRSTMKKHHKKPNDEEVLKINWKRVAITSMFGVGFVGPVGHFWYEYLDRFMKVRLQLPPKSMRFVAAKVALDGVIFGPIDLCVFFTYMGLTSCKSIPQVKDDLKRDFLLALVFEGGVWPVYSSEVLTPICKYVRLIRQCPFIVDRATEGCSLEEVDSLFSLCKGARRTRLMLLKVITTCSCHFLPILPCIFHHFPCD
ncbi:hypothetical protein GIB67_008828, partial [Kingdonia uniflora]